jgi:O-antigen ligase
MKWTRIEALACVVILLLALLSVADRSHAGWMAVRALAFAGCLLFSSKHRGRLLQGLAAGFASIAVAGIAGLDLAIACLAFCLFRLKLGHLAALIAAFGILGTFSFAYCGLGYGGLGFAQLFPFHNRNHYAVFVELGLPILVYAYRRGQSRILLYAAGLMLVTALAGGSRTGAVLLLIEASAVWVAVGGREKAWITAPAVAIAASLFFLMADGDRIQNPLAGDHRLEIWRSGIAMVAAKPLTGWGMGEFSRAYPAYALFDNGEFVNAAHSDWIEWAIEFGVIPVVGFFAIFLWWLRKKIQFYPSWGILVGALHAAVDYPFHLPGLLVFAAALAGSLKANGTSIEAKSTDRQRRNR